MKAELITKNKACPSKLQRRRGFSLIEILIAIAVLTLSISAVILLVFANQNMKIDVLTNNEGVSKAQELIEGLRAKSRQNFSSVVTVAPAADGIYTKGAVVTDIDLFTKLITTTVTWAESAVRPITVKFATIVTDPQSAFGGDTCNPVLSGDWTDPQLLGAADVGQNNGGTDADVFNKKAYVTANAAAAGKHDFYIVDVSDPVISNLPVLGSINTGPGLAAVHVAGTYAYTANLSRTGQLQIIDISNATAPALIKSFKLTNVTGSGSQALGNSIYFKNKYVYIGLTKTATGPEFNIIDVSDPANPIWKGGYSLGHDINAIFVKGDYAYVASPDNKELIVLDVSNPTMPVLAGQLDLSDNSANGKSIAISGTIMFLGRTEGASPATKELQMINIADPLNPVAGGSADVDSTINAVIIRTNLVFVVTADTNLGFQIWDTNTMSLYGSKNIQQTSTGGMDCEGNYVFVAQRSNKALQIIGPGP